MDIDVLRQKFSKGASTKALSGEKFKLGNLRVPQNMSHVRHVFLSIFRF